MTTHDEVLARACAPFDLTGVTLPDVAAVDARFRQWCADNGVTILRQLQQGCVGERLSAHVYLAIDTDGLVKVFKQLIVRVDSEVDILRRAQGIRGVPVFYGAFDIVPGVSFLRMEMCWGQDLSDWVRTGKPMAPEEAHNVTRRLAEILAELHARGIVYLDLKPENVRVNGDEVTLLDFNASRFLDETVVNTPIIDPRYAAPETTLHGVANPASDVFALGVLHRQLLDGRHPFIDGQPTEDGSIASGIERYALPMALQPGARESRLRIDPSERPSMREVVVSLPSGNIEVAAAPRRAPGQRERNTVLFPARMGIPHKGHIEFVSRLLEMGYFVLISLQSSYVITPIDPIPKWQVRKMLARSLLRRGFSADDFDIMLTPLLNTQQEVRLHFTMMPGWEDVVAMATGNEDVPRLFPSLSVITQRAVFAGESEEYVVRSWGERLRRAVREGDRGVFDELAAPGVREILSFEELRAQDLVVPVGFIHGQVRVEVDGVSGGCLQERVRRYEHPEETVVRLCRDHGRALEILDPFARDTLATLDGDPVRLRYERMRLDQLDEIICYKIVPA